MASDAGGTDSAVWHHAMNRGGSRRDVLPVPADHDDFVELAAQLRQRYGVEIHAYCLMGNHYHVLVRAALVDPRPGLCFLDDGYRKRFHERHVAGGKLLAERFHVVPITAGRHLAYVSRYIHLNPVEAALALRPEDWPFSSYRAYLDPQCAPPWLATRTIVDWLGSLGGRRRYRAFVEQGLDPGSRDFFGRRRACAMPGDDFHEELGRRLALESIVAFDPRGPEAHDLGDRDRAAPPLAAIARVVAEEFAVPLSHLAPRSRVLRPDGRLARGAMIHAARRLGGYRLREIAAWIGYASSIAAADAARAFADRARSDPAVEHRLTRVLERAAFRAPY